MGPRTERDLLPPESARAIYATIEAQGEGLRHEIAHGAKATNERLDHIVQSLDEMKEQMADGRVKFESHEGKLTLLDNKITHVDRRVDDVKHQIDDVESDFGKIYPAILQKTPPARPLSTPTGHHPTVTNPPNPRRLPEPSTALEKKPKLLFSISPKLINAFLLAVMAVVGTAFGGWIVSRLTDLKIAQMLDANAKAAASQNAPTNPPAPLP